MTYKDLLNIIGTLSTDSLDEDVVIMVETPGIFRLENTTTPVWVYAGEINNGVFYLKANVNQMIECLRCYKEFSPQESSNVRDEINGFDTEPRLKARQEIDVWGTCKECFEKWRDEA